MGSQESHILAAATPALPAQSFVMESSCVPEQVGKHSREGFIGSISGAKWQNQTQTLGKESKNRNQF